MATEYEIARAEAMEWFWRLPQRQILTTPDPETPHLVRVPAFGCLELDMLPFDESEDVLGLGETHELAVMCAYVVYHAPARQRIHTSKVMTCH